MSQILHRLAPKEGATHSEKRLGRGEGSGHGKTASRGHKGDQSRSGYRRKRGFEGGQMPLQRRIPKFGFQNPFRVAYAPLSLKRLNRLLEAHPELQHITPTWLYEHRVIRKEALIKVLGKETLLRPITIEAHRFSAGALAAIEAAGGKAVSSSA
jgi:large subunit ribosomal protein L15